MDRLSNYRSVFWCCVKRVLRSLFGCHSLNYSFISFSCSINFSTFSCSFVVLHSFRVLMLIFLSFSFFPVLRISFVRAASWLVAICLMTCLEFVQPQWMDGAGQKCEGRRSAIYVMRMLMPIRQAEQHFLFSSFLLTFLRAAVCFPPSLACDWSAMGGYVRRR